MILIISTLFSCGDKVEDTSSPPTTDTSVAPDETDPCEGIEGSTDIGMSGSVEFSDGTPAQGNVRVQMCNENLCYVARWNNESDFCFPVGTFPANMPYAFDLVPTLDGSETYAQPLSILSPSESITLTETVIIPNYSTTWTTSENTLELNADNGLTISINSEYAEDTLSAIALDLENGGLPLGDFTNEQIVGAWYLGPFDVHVSGLDFEYNNPSVTEGTSYTIYNGDYEGKQWLQTAEVTATEDGTLTVPGGISILSTLLISQ